MNMSELHSERLCVTDIVHLRRENMFLVEYYPRFVHQQHFAWMGLWHQLFAIQRWLQHAWWVKSLW